MVTWSSRHFIHFGLSQSINMYKYNQPIAYTLTWNKNCNAAMRYDAMRTSWIILLSCNSTFKLMKEKDTRQTIVVHISKLWAYGFGFGIFSTILMRLSGKWYVWAREYDCTNDENKKNKTIIYVYNLHGGLQIASLQCSTTISSVDEQYCGWEKNICFIEGLINWSIINWVLEAYAVKYRNKTRAWSLTFYSVALVFKLIAYAISHHLLTFNLSKDYNKIS